MAKIKLTQGKFAIVDDIDFEYLSQWKWYYCNTGYARRTTLSHSFMHRIINDTPKGLLTDHINRNPLDNRRANLRTADKRVNSINRNLQSNNTSGFKGISWNKHLRKWETYIFNNQIKIPLGFFTDIRQACLVRKNAEKFYHATI